MRRFQQKRHIDAPVDRVWAILTDVERWPEWTASMTRITPADSGPLGPGARFHIEQPKLKPAIWTVSLWEPKRRFAWGTTSAGVGVQGDHIIEERDGGCDVTIDLTLKGWLGGLIGIVSRKVIERYVRLESEGLKKRSESAVGEKAHSEATV